jgi:hypothetical protein
MEGSPALFSTLDFNVILLLPLRQAGTPARPRQDRGKVNKLFCEPFKIAWLSVGNARPPQQHQCLLCEQARSLDFSAVSGWGERWT